MALGVGTEERPSPGSARQWWNLWKGGTLPACQPLKGLGRVSLPPTRILICSKKCLKVERFSDWSSARMTFQLLAEYTLQDKSFRTSGKK